MDSFEKRLEMLESLTEKIRDKDIPLEEAMKLFENGVNLSRELEKELEGFEQKIEILTNEPPQDGSGETELKSYTE